MKEKLEKVIEEYIHSDKQMILSYFNELNVTALAQAILDNFEVKEKE